MNGGLNDCLLSDVQGKRARRTTKRKKQQRKNLVERLPYTEDHLGLSTDYELARARRALVDEKARLRAAQPTPAREDEDFLLQFRAGAAIHVIERWGGRLFEDWASLPMNAVFRAAELREWRRKRRARAGARHEELVVSAIGRKHGEELVFTECLRAVAQIEAERGDERLHLVVTPRTAYLAGVASGVLTPPRNEEVMRQAEKRISMRWNREPPLPPLLLALKRMLKAKWIPWYPDVITRIPPRNFAKTGARVG
jgi:hypothetical protein